MFVRTTLIVSVMLIVAAAAVNADQSSTSSASAPLPASAANATPGPAAAAPAASAPNVAFDQVDRTLDGSATPPPLTAFADQLQAAKDAQNATGLSAPKGPGAGNMLVGMIPVVGTIVGMSQAHKQMEAAKKQQQAMLDRMKEISPPVLTRYAFYNGWTRVETANSIIITKPDQHLTIFIDPHAKTYRTYDMSAASETQQAPAAPPAQATGSASANSMISMGPADSATIDGQQALGYSAEAIVTLSQSQGSCQDGTFRAKKLVYFAPLPEPLRQVKEDAIDSLALPSGCTAELHRQASGTPEPTGQMYVYKLVTVVRDLNALTQHASSGNAFDPSVFMQRAMSGTQGRNPPNYMKLSQRGNIRQLTAADASLFDVPDDYKKDQ